MNYKVLCRKVQKLCDGAILKKAGISQLKEELNDLFDAEIGYMPAKAVHMLGAEYTPQEFAHSVLLSRGVCIAHQFLASSLQRILCARDSR